MSVVDIWDWDKLNPEEFEEPLEIDTHTKLQIMIDEFRNRFGFFPNKITIGCKLADELCKQFLIEDSYMRCGTNCKYAGIPVIIHEDNSDILEVGYMMKWYDEMDRG